MPITTERFLTVLSIAEDLQAVTAEMRTLVNREMARWRRGEATAEEVLDNLDLMLQPEAMMTVQGGRRVLERERLFFSPARVRENEKMRRKQQRRRARHRDEKALNQGDWDDLSTDNKEPKL